MTSTAANNEVGIHRRPAHVVADDGTRTVRVSLIYPDASIDHLGLIGSDEVLFASMKRLVGDCVLTPIPISDHDGVAARGWVDEDGEAKRLRLNRIASKVADRPIYGRMIVTGLGRGETESVTSVHDGLERVLDQMVSRARAR